MGVGSRPAQSLRDRARGRPAHRDGNARPADVGPRRRAGAGHLRVHPREPGRGPPAGAERRTRPRRRANGRACRRGAVHSRLQRPVTGSRLCRAGDCVGQAKMAAPARNIRGGVAAAVHQPLHELAGLLHGSLGVARLLDRAAGRRARQPAVVLLHHRPLGLRVRHRYPRHHRQPLPAGTAAQHVRHRHRGLDMALLRHLLVRGRADALAADGDSRALRIRRRPHRWDAGRACGDPPGAPRRAAFVSHVPCAFRAARSPASAAREPCRTQARRPWRAGAQAGRIHRAAVDGAAARTGPSRSEGDAGGRKSLRTDLAATGGPDARHPYRGVRHDGIHLRARELLLRRVRASPGTARLFADRPGNAVCNGMHRTLRQQRRARTGRRPHPR